jgi:hypothetical protein
MEQLSSTLDRETVRRARFARRPIAELQRRRFVKADGFYE